MPHNNSEDPTTCYICTRQATGLGLSPKPPYNWICKECAVSIDDLSRVKRPSAYEIKARLGGMEAAGEYLRQLGKTDLAEFEEDEALMFCGAVWKGCADRLRELVRSDAAPF